MNVGEEFDLDHYGDDDFDALITRPIAYEEPEPEPPLSSIERNERIIMVRCGDCWAEPQAACKMDVWEFPIGERFHQGRINRTIRAGLLPEEVVQHRIGLVHTD